MNISENPLITIIVPIYKVEQYLNRCVDSIINQTYKNLEIILVDDGSPDRCGEICEQYATKYSRIKVIHKKNGGLSDARNYGIDIAEGDYITFVDSDDWIVPYYIETLLKILVDENADISVGNFKKVTSVDYKIPINEHTEIKIYTDLEILKQLYNHNYIKSVIACAKIYKRSLFDGIRFPVGRLHEDEFTTYKLFYRAKRAVYTNQEIYYYWQRSDSIMGTVRKFINVFDKMEAYEEQLAFYSKHKLYWFEEYVLRKIFSIIVNAYENPNHNKKEKRILKFKAKQCKLYTYDIKHSINIRVRYSLFIFSPLLFMCLDKTVICFIRYLTNKHCDVENQIGLIQK